MARDVMHPSDVARGLGPGLNSGDVYLTPAGREVLVMTGGAVRSLPRDWLTCQPKARPGESPSWDAFLAVARRQSGRIRKALLKGAGLTEQDLL